MVGEREGESVWVSVFELVCVRVFGVRVPLIDEVIDWLGDGICVTDGDCDWDWDCVWDGVWVCV